jgi:hypothetical protein
MKYCSVLVRVDVDLAEPAERGIFLTSSNSKRRLFSDVRNHRFPRVSRPVFPSL